MAESIYGKARSFTGESLREVAFPLGGIGTGTVSLGGRGNLRDFEIFNRPGKGCVLPYTFFSIWARPRGGEPVARVLERRFLPPYVIPPTGTMFSGSGFGLPTAQVSGLPRLAEAVFRGAYPFAGIAFSDPALPAAVSVEAWSPMIPMDERASGFPAAVFAWTVENRAGVPLDATVALSCLNACGHDGKSPLGSRKAPLFGANRNRLVRDGRLSMIRMETGKHPKDHPQSGTMAAGVLADEVTAKTRWERAAWWDDVQAFWDDFSADGLLTDVADPGESPDAETDVGTIGARLSLAAGARATVPFFLAWHFPSRLNTWNAEERVKGKPVGVWYATQWPDASSVLAELASRHEELERATRRFAGAFFDSTLPPEVLDAASANASILRTTTCLRTPDGAFHAFEGCGDSEGCCPMNCTHVWNYEQAVAHLYPALERSMRRTDFLLNTKPDGDQAFRTLVPTGPEQWWKFPPAADGQMGTVMKAYREWILSGDEAFLREIFPAVERSVRYAWSEGSWDADQDGVMEGIQHNTYDIEFHGPNTMMGTFYLGALRAAERMARACGREDFAAECRVVYESGRGKMAEALFNGEWFVQHVAPQKPGKTAVAPPPAACCAPGTACGPEAKEQEAWPRYQYGAGCLADQLLGEWFAQVVGLEGLLPREQVRSALASIFRHNFKRDLSAHASVQRVYAANDEGGLLLCTWPRGGRPSYPFPYADEVWTGIEYQVAAHCLYEGMIDEGLAIVRAVRDRHDGAKRNPWDEFECGHHYARAMSSWSLVTALSGFRWDAVDGALGFAPRLSAEDFRGFFSAGTGWGTFSQRREKGAGGRWRAEVSLDGGALALRTLRLPWLSAGKAEARLDGKPLSAKGEAGAVSFSAPAVLAAGSRLEVLA